MYTPRTIGSPVSAESTLLAGKLREGRVTLLLGAGFSRGDPTSLPLGHELAQRIYSSFKNGFASEALVGVASDDLLAVADAIASCDNRGLRRLQQYLASSVPLDSAAPNHAHRILVNLVAEELVSEAMTTNYDTCVERAGASLGEPCIVACRIPSEVQMGGAKGRLLKLHGCVTNEVTMLITSEQLRAPDQWVPASLIDASTKDTLVILGINSVAPYVEDTLKRVWAYAKDAESIWIVSPTIDDASWDDLIGEGNASPRIHKTAEEFLDELLSACLQDQFSQLRQIAEALDSDGDSVQNSVAVIEAFIESLGQIPVLGFVMALRAGLTRKETPLAFAISDLGLGVLYVLSLAQLAADAELRVKQVGDRAWLKLDDIVVAFARGRGPMTGGELAEAIESDLTDAKARGLLARDDRVIAIASGFVGQLPGKSLPADILGEPGLENLIDGPDRLSLVWLPLSHLAETRVEVGRQIIEEALR